MIRIHSNLKDMSQNYLPTFFFLFRFNFNYFAVFNNNPSYYLFQSCMTTTDVSSSSMTAYNPETYLRMIDVCFSGIGSAGLLWTFD